jgi:hypothetical protein
MHGRAEEAVRDLRERMAAETRTLKELERQFQHPYFKKRAMWAINDAEEAEIMFLRPLEKENWRDVQQELAAVGYAETIFQMAVSQRKQLEEVMEKYGPTAVVVPYP